MQILKIILCILIVMGVYTRISAQNTSYEVFYKTKTPRSHSLSVPILEKGSLWATLYRQDSEYLYFKIIPQQQRYIQLSRKMYKMFHLMTGDTILYDPRPDIGFRIKQIRINRTVRRFKR